MFEGGKSRVFVKSYLAMLANNCCFCGSIVKIVRVVLFSSDHLNRESTKILS